MELKLSQSSSLPAIIFTSSTKHFTILAQRWKLDIKRIPWKGQNLSNKILVHVVKEGETLSSISKLYGVPILEITAANKDIVNVDVDVVSKGQHLNIPSAVAGFAQMCHFAENKLHDHQLTNAAPSLGFHSRLPLAKTSGSFLVLVPLIAFCIQCIIGAFRNRKSRHHRAAKKSGVHHQSSSNSMRWKTVLSDSGDLSALDAESEPDSDPPLEDEEKLRFEDISHDFTKLEGDYQQFLSECGMSNWGYWRGGSPK